MPNKKLNRKTLAISVSFGLIMLLIVSFLAWPNIQNLDKYDLKIQFLIIILLPVFLCGIVFWVYQEIEYEMEKYGDSRRTWYSWIWWPLRSWGEAYYFGQLSRLILVIPFLTYIWVALIGGYSINLGIVSAIVTFLFSLFAVSKLNHWLEKKEKAIKHIYKKNKWRIFGLSVIISLIIVIPLLLAAYLNDTDDFYQLYPISIVIFVCAYMFFLVISYMCIEEYYRFKGYY